MWRGTTPTHSFTLPENIRITDFAVAYVTYSQNEKTILEKTKSDLEPTENGFRVTFSQADTLQFKPGPVRIQVRARLNNGTAVASNIILSTAKEVLKDGEI